MPVINPYLIFNGNCEEAFHFYQSVFGGTLSPIGRFKDMDSNMPVSEEEANKVMHISLPIGKGSVLMGGDTMNAMGAAVMGSNFSIALQPDTEADADRLFSGLSEGGNVTMPMGKAFWGAYYGMFTDKFGIHWQVNYEYAK